MNESRNRISGHHMTALVALVGPTAFDQRGEDVLSQELVRVYYGSLGNRLPPILNIFQNRLEGLLSHQALLVHMPNPHSGIVFPAFSTVFSCVMECPSFLQSMVKGYIVPGDSEDVSVGAIFFRLRAIESYLFRGSKTITLLTA